MCGRYTLKKRPEELRKKIPFQGDDRALAPRYNIAPTQLAPVITGDLSGNHRLTLMRWGLVPSWAKDPAMGNRMINARSETLATKPAFRSLLKHKRCLVPADGFYEWKKMGRSKQPFYIEMKEGQPFAMAGLWDHWQDVNGTELETFTIVTTEANAAMKSLHHRMPVILSPSALRQWLDPKPIPPSALSAMLIPWSEDNLTLTPVSPRVNSPAHDDPDCIVPIRLAQDENPPQNPPKNLEFDL